MRLGDADQWAQETSRLRIELPVPLLSAQERTSTGRGGGTNATMIQAADDEDSGV